MEVDREKKVLRTTVKDAEEFQTKHKRGEESIQNLRLVSSGVQQKDGETYYNRSSNTWWYQGPLIALNGVSGDKGIILI